MAGQSVSHSVSHSVRGATNRPKASPTLARDTFMRVSELLTSGGTGDAKPIGGWLELISNVQHLRFKASDAC
jgi:hypothetical protein